MLNINGKCQVTKLNEISPKMVVGTIITYEKVEDDFIPTFINAKFVGKSINTIMNEDIRDKDKIMINNGVLSTRQYKNKDGETVSQLQATIFEIEAVKEEKKPQEKKNIGNTRFVRK